MHNKPSLLDNHLYSTGTRFTVTSAVKENSFTPSSIGFISYMTQPDYDYQNVASMKVVIIRRGKGGQKRININDISIPIFSNEDMLKHENYLPVGRRYYVHIEPIPFDEENLLNIKPLDFLGWSCAYAVYLRYLALEVSYPRGINQWPNDDVDNPLRKAYLLTQRFEESPEAYLRDYGGVNFRTALISEARKLESVLIKCVTSYKKNVIDAILNSAHFLEYTNKEYYKVANEALIKSTINFYEKKHNQIKNMIKKPNKEKKKSVKEMAATYATAENVTYVAAEGYLSESSEAS